MLRLDCQYLGIHDITDYLCWAWCNTLAQSWAYPPFFIGLSFLFMGIGGLLNFEQAPLFRMLRLDFQYLGIRYGVLCRTAWQLTKIKHSRFGKLKHSYWLPCSVVYVPEKSGA